MQASNSAGHVFGDVLRVQYAALSLRSTIAALRLTFAAILVIAYVRLLAAIRNGIIP